MGNVRIACAGAWHSHAKDFANRIADIPDAELAAVWDSSPETAKAWAEEKGCRCYTDYDELIHAGDIDGVIVTCPTVQHADLMIRAAAAGKNVYVEKALCANMGQALGVQKAIHEAQEKYGIHFVMSDPVQKSAVLYAKGLMEQGVLGRVLSVRSRSGHDLAFGNPQEVEGYQKPDENGGGVLLDMGHHAVHVIHFLLGNPIRAAAMFQTVSDLSRGTGGEDHCVAMFQYPDGAVGIAESGLVTPKFESGLEIVGTKGHFVSVDKMGARLTTTDGGTREIPEGEMAEAYPNPQRYWIKCIHDNVPCELYQVDEAVEIIKMIEMAYRSRKDQQALSQKVPGYLEGIHAKVYQDKLDIMHPGPCSSPRGMNGTCPCPMDCPLHGRCCDCIRHHLEHQKEGEKDYTYQWLPRCLKDIYTDDL